MDLCKIHYEKEYHYNLGNSIKYPQLIQYKIPYLPMSYLTSVKQLVNEKKKTKYETLSNAIKMRSGYFLIGINTDDPEQPIVVLANPHMIEKIKNFKNWNIDGKILFFINSKNNQIIRNI